jgi:DNA-binding MarR family transcriptional regulator
MTRIDFGILLGLAFQSFVDELHVDLAARGFAPIGAWDGYVLRALADGPKNQRALAEHLGITEQGAGKVIADLRRRKLLARTPDPADARAWLLDLAERGTAMLRAARAFHARYEAALARELGADAATTRRVLEAILDRSPPETRARLKLP